MCNNKLKESDKLYIYEVCEEFGFQHTELIAILHRIQKKFGFLPEIVQEEVSKCMKISLAKVYGVVSFYSFFKMTPSGKFPVSVCTGTACYVRGVEAVLDKFEHELGIKVGETTPDGLFSLTTLRCVGACGLAPVATIGDKIYGHLTADKVKDILKYFNSKS